MIGWILRPRICSCDAYSGSQPQRDLKAASARSGTSAFPAAALLTWRVLLEVRNLNVQFPSGTRSLTAVRDVSFGIPRGQVLGLVGESGSGKSVTSLAVMRLLPSLAQVSGEVVFQNHHGEPENLLGLPPEDMRRLR